MKKIVGRLVLVAILVAAGVGGWIWYHDDEAAPTNELVLYGNVDIRQVDLAFNGSERIDTMLVEEGDQVTKGQLLASLDTQRLADAVAQARAQVAERREVLSKLEAGTREEEIRKARADVESAQADADNANLNLRRLQHLASSNAAPQQDLDNARAAANVAQARLKAAKETLDLAIAGPREQDIAAARAGLHAAEAAASLAERNLANAQLYAPDDGTIQDRILEPGAMAFPQTPVYTLALTDPIWVRTYVSEANLGKIRPGMKAYVSTDSYPGKRYEGWVGFISPTAEFTPKTVQTPELRTHLVYQIRVNVHNDGGELRLGMPATVTIPLDQSDSQAAPSDNEGA